MLTCHMLIGPSCSGKTTFTKGYLLDLYALDRGLSTDTFIENFAVKCQKTYTEIFHDAIEAAEAYLNQKLLTFKSREEEFFWDQTNLTRKSRARKLAKLSPEYDVKAYVFMPPPTTIFNRLEKRNADGFKFIPPDVVRQQIASYEEPLLSEGFTSINKVS